MKSSLSVAAWAICNGLVQCMGCKGFGPSLDMKWYRWRGTVMPYCTEECYEGDKND